MAKDVSIEEGCLLCRDRAHDSCLRGYFGVNNHVKISFFKFDTCSSKHECFACERQCVDFIGLIFFSVWQILTLLLEKKKKKLLAVTLLPRRPYFIQAPWGMCTGGLHATHKVIYFQITFFFFLAGTLKCAVSKIQNMHSHLTWRGGGKKSLRDKKRKWLPA